MANGQLGAIYRPRSRCDFLFCSVVPRAKGGESNQMR
ncbi:predicted protein [Plenodomus lingam JN3]|uniref:Predicted protein n=1 Tax=Leptosphaeria maculans (strain JN3 / isolate v23.1.3 / race Av1-4-5-6-7-8) TaxID=985895 RepID=E4ZHR1_LEPMJ|nr:predicted protein [Plenodomus lingam JN3]CBX90894.1 predicted protein [Plenodomus lingam JN3]